MTVFHGCIKGTPCEGSKQNKRNRFQSSLLYATATNACPGPDGLEYPNITGCLQSKFNLINSWSNRRLTEFGVSGIVVYASHFFSPKHLFTLSEISCNLYPPEQIPLNHAEIHAECD